MDQRFKVEGEKVCPSCKKGLPLGDFIGDKSKPDGVGSYCKFCSKPKKKQYARERRDRHKEEFGVTETQKLYAENRFQYMMRSYINYDKKKGRYTQRSDYFDDLELLRFLRKGGCSYCGHGFENDLGLDRIDNSKGHQRENVLRCCGDCNRVRGDRFSLDEMKQIGRVIGEIKRNRLDKGEPPLGS